VHQVAIEAAMAAQFALPVFVPVVEVSGVARGTESPMPRVPARKSPSQRPSVVPARLTAQLPNGATVALECDGQDIVLVRAMIDALGAR
jgi:transposase